MSEIVNAGVLKIYKFILFYHDKHYDTFKSLPTFFSNSDFCFSCFKSYDILKSIILIMCLKNVSVVNATLFNCNSHLCYINHREKVCSKIEKCIACGAFNIFSNNCQGKWCMFCRKYVDTSVLF